MVTPPTTQRNSWTQQLQPITTTSVPPPVVSPFCSTFDAFNLHSRQIPPSPGGSSNGNGMQIDSSMNDGEEYVPNPLLPEYMRSGSIPINEQIPISIPIFPSSSSNSNNSNNGSNSSAFWRKQSLLGSQLLNQATSNSNRLDSSSPIDDSDDAQMLLGSPVLDLSNHHSNLISRRNGLNQRTPPPFLQRRLFNGQSGEEDNLSATSNSAMMEGLPTLESRSSESLVEEDEDDNFSLGLAIPDRAKDNGSGSGSGSGGEEGRVVRRPLSRKPNLLPKPKSHLRVLSQLRTEDGVADLEIASEAALHRLSKSGAGTVHRPSTISSTSVPPSPFTPGNIHPRPTPNRFPEQVDEEEENRIGSDDSSTGDEETGLEDMGDMGSDFGGNMSVSGYGTEDEEENKRASIWTGIRGNGSSSAGLNVSALGFGSASRSPGERSRSEIEMQMQAHNNSPSASVWNTSRPGKRKNVDDRFEPYSQAFKRRAVSPAASIMPGNNLASPILQYTTSTSFPTPPPLTLNQTMSNNYSTALSLSLPIQIPSPTGSPFGSLSSSAGRSSYKGNSGAMGIAMIMSGRAEREEAEKNRKEEGNNLSRMSLG